MAPELIDDQPLDACPLGGFQQLYRAVQLRKHAASVDISRQQHRCIHQLCQPHIDDIIRFQVDLCRAARALNDDDIHLFSKTVVGG